MYLIFDTETTGLPKNWKAPITDVDNWPRCIQIAWQLHDSMGRLIEHKDFLIKPQGFDIPYDSEKIHGISTQLAQKNGVEIEYVLQEFNKVINQAKFIVGQNIDFDLNIMGCEFHRFGVETQLNNLPKLDTCTEDTAELTRLPGGRGGRFKLPTLTELHHYLFNAPFAEAHNATADVEATTRCFLELIRREFFSIEQLQESENYFEEYQKVNPHPIEVIGLKHLNLKEASAKLKEALQQDISVSEMTEEVAEMFAQAKFSHLHCHTEFSVLQSPCSVAKLVKTAIDNQMPAVAITDHGNMMGAFQFVRDVLKHNKSVENQTQKELEQGIAPTMKPIKPIVGCEFNVCENHLDKTKKDDGYKIVILAKNKNGYHNLVKLSSIASTVGFYYVPRIDKKLIEEYKSDLIVLTGGLQGEVPNKILNVGEKQAEDALIWWKQLFGDDLYIEIMNHGQEDEQRVNATLLRFSEKHSVKLIATNNTYYLKKEDANVHDILLCVRDGEKKDTPIGRERGNRFGMPNQEYYFKSEKEMKEVFKQFPQAIINIQEVVDKVEPYKLEREVLLPKFEIPEEFKNEEDEKDGGKRGENNYLKFLTYEGAKRRYGEITEEIASRLDFELATIEKTGYPGYFLIVQDFIAAARDMGVSVGPGRGSAAGSAVAYCLGITNLDPIEYDLLFERFLNPDRVSMPDIDIDFEDEGRALVMDYVIKKYGKSQVAQIITYGRMAPKSAIRDTARVLDLSLQDADRIAKLIPDMMPSKWSLERFFSEDEATIKKALKTSEEFERIKHLRQIEQEDSLMGETLRQAKSLEGSMRNTGVHACGVVITPDDITKFVPVANGKDSELFVTQFDNNVAESAGLLKMDFLGLKTLTLIKDTCKIVKHRTGKDLDMDKIPLDDEKTYQLFQRGETVGIFQYESNGMQKYMKELKPTVFADLIAMNALYRPGPLEYIPTFINRKHGIEPITYDLEACEEYLKETYGVTVYQEQVMLLSQKLAGFTKGEADVLRKAMGKKQKDVLDKMKPKFVEQAAEKGHNKEALEKIWTDWEAFASYAFNKSHSTCYAWIGYQTAYLKAHYPAEYMAAVLSNNMNNISSVTFFMEECKRMGLSVLPPDVNESFYKFTVNDNYEIRFGMGALKGVGEGAVNTIIENREKGKYKSIFDLAKRIDLRSANKKTFESLALAGGFDCFENVNRAQYFHLGDDNLTLIEKAIKYGVKYQENENSVQVSLFGDASEVQIPEPEIAYCDEWGVMEKLNKEKDIVGIYISGHPLDQYNLEMKYFCSTTISNLYDLRRLLGKTISFAGIITDVQKRMNKKTEKDMFIINIEGYNDSYKMIISDPNFLMKYGYLLVKNEFVYFEAVVKEGWIDKLTGMPREPRLDFKEIKLLNKLIEDKAKELCILFEIRNFNQILIDKIYELINMNKGDKKLSFEVFELVEADKNKKEIHYERNHYGHKTNIIDNLIPKKNRIAISKTMLKYLENLKINFRLG